MLPSSAQSDQQLNLRPFDNVQGDVILGLHKRVESFIFISITDVPSFRHILQTKLAPCVSSTRDVLAASAHIATARSHVHGKRVWLPIQHLNIGFSAVGLEKLGIDVATDFKADLAFATGMEVDALTNLADPQITATMGTAAKLISWKAPYLGKKIDAVFIVTAAKQHELDAEIVNLLAMVHHSVKIVYQIEGVVRPGAEEGHEHFGYRDGISQPTVIGFNDTDRPKLQSAVESSIILTGQGVTPPSWIENGSFLVFRELQQLVPEFNAFVKTVAEASQLTLPGVTPDAIGARIVGRWKSGAPVVLTPTKDDHVLGADKTRNDNFDFSADLDQKLCPYSAHIRKTNPRSGTAPANIPVLPSRHFQGIPYGHELTHGEKHKNKTIHERGLLSACCQSSIESGFQFRQKLWANNAAFPFNNTAKIITPGIDLIIGQVATGDRITQGIKPNDADDAGNTVDAKQEFVTPRAGEYFFVPSVDALKTKLGA